MCGVLATGVWVLKAGLYVGDPPQSPPEEYLHPIITEILFAVPSKEGDASGDGRRDATGDEFIEIVNWSSRPLQLEGYALTDRNPVERGQMKFVFPRFTLAPGEVAVIFNGRNQEWEGPVGDDERAPVARHDKFGGAWVFTMRNESDMTGLSNSGDWVLLTSPAGEALSCIAWGEYEGAPEIESYLLEKVEAVKGASIQRSRTTGKFVSHRDLGEKKLLFSPGVFPWPGEEPSQAP